MADKPSPEFRFGVYDETALKDQKWKILLYGQSGSGKTYMAGTFPDPIFLDLEDGMLSVGSLKKKIYRYPADVNEQISDFAAVKKFYNQIVKMNPSEVPFKTIVVDSLNELQVLVMKQILGTISADRIYVDQPTYGDYGKLARDIQTIVRQFFQLPYHVIFTCAANDKEYAAEKSLPLLMGKKSGPDIRRIIKQIGFCYTKQDKDQPSQHMVCFEDSPLYLAKDRTGKLVRPLPNTYEAMMKFVQTNNNGEKL